MVDPPVQTSPGWQRRRSPSLIFPIVLIVAGLILLLNNLGVVPWSIWPSLARLWPVLLILLGLDLLVGRGSPWFGAAIAVLMLGLVVGVALWTGIHGIPPGTPSAQLSEATLAAPLNGASSGDVTVDFGAGRLDVGALPGDSPSLVQVTAQLTPGATLPPLSTRLENGTELVTIQVRGGPRGWIPFGADPARETTMNLSLNPRIPETLRFNLGAGQSTLDLTAIPVRDLTVNNGAGQLEVRFPAGSGQSTANIHSGAGQITLIIPPGVGASIHNSSGLVNLHLSNRFQAVSDGYQTADYGTAANRVNITLQVGVGQVDVR